MGKRADVINEAVSTEMAAHNIEDTVENRLLFLQGLEAGWKEDTDSSLEKSLYQLALTGEIVKLTIKRDMGILAELNERFQKEK